jgi:SPP1 Gp6-like portal protein
MSSTANHSGKEENKQMSYLTKFIDSMANRFGSGRNQITGGYNAAASALAYFNGCAPNTLVIKDVDDNVHITYAEVIVSKGVAFLFGKSLQISIGTEEDKTGEEYLKKVWPEKQRKLNLIEAATEGAISGNAYLKISIQADGKPRVTVGDPNTYSVVTDPHDVTRAMRFVCQYEIPGERADRPILYKEETSRNEGGRSWRIVESHSFDKGKSWVVISDNQWNFAFAPIFHCQNLVKSKSFCGRADLRPDVLRLISCISRLDSLCNKVVRVHSSPKPYATGLKKQDMELSTEGVMFLPGGINGIEAKVGLLEMTGNLSGAREFRKDLREGLAEMTKVPEVATGKVEQTGAIAGVALRILYGPLLDQTELKQLTYGVMIEEVVMALLAIGKVSGEVALHWPDPLPANETEAVQVAEGKKRLGVSGDTLVKEMGYDPKAERDKTQAAAQDVGTELLTAFDRGAGAEALAA